MSVVIQESREGAAEVRELIDGSIDMLNALLEDLLMGDIDALRVATRQQLEGIRGLACLAMGEAVIRKQERERAAE